MNLGRCPVCHSRISLESCVQDEAGRELLAAVAQLDAALAVPLVTYLGLFRAPNRDLANDRALRLLREVMELGEPGHGYGPRLARALADTVEAIRAKGGVPLKSHNYLKRVLESAPAEVASVSVQPVGQAFSSRTAAALMALQEPVQ